MFNLSTFIKSNLLNGYKNGSFSIEQVNIYCANYLFKGLITQADFDEIQAALNPPDIVT